MWGKQKVQTVKVIRKPTEMWDAQCHILRVDLENHWWMHASLKSMTVDLAEGAQYSRTFLFWSWTLLRRLGGTWQWCGEQCWVCWLRKAYSIICFWIGTRAHERQTIADAGDAGRSRGSFVQTVWAEIERKIAKLERPIIHQWVRIVGSCGKVMWCLRSNEEPVHSAWSVTRTD